MNLKKCCDFKTGFFIGQKKNMNETLDSILSVSWQNPRSVKGGQGLSSHKVKFVK